MRFISITSTSVGQALDDAEYLDKFDALLLYANHPKITALQWKNLLSFVKGGKGFVPVHCASWCFSNAFPNSTNSWAGALRATKGRSLARGSLPRITRPFPGWRTSRLGTKLTFITDTIRRIALFLWFAIPCPVIPTKSGTVDLGQDGRQGSGILYRFRA